MTLERIDRQIVADLEGRLALAKLRQRLEHAIGEVALAGGRERYVEVVLEVCAKAKKLEAEAT